VNAEHVLDLMRQAIKTLVLLSAPLLGFGLVVGVLTNIFQAVTQITETTLATVPKILAMLLAFVIFAPWMLDIIIDFTTNLYDSIPLIIR
jgi:flagellar biosynthetic protein FliQ